MKRKALFLDRDGVINKDFGYVCEVERLEYVDGIFDLCRRAKLSGYVLIVITNQAGIGRGFYTEERFLDFMQIIKKKFIEENCELDGVYYCPHHPTGGIGQYKKCCNSRKPNNGMILKAAKDFNLNCADSILIGDKDTDLIAGTKSKIGKLYLYAETSDSSQKFTCVQTLDQIALH